jgi:hypothetical protein
VGRHERVTKRRRWVGFVRLVLLSVAWVGIHDCSTHQPSSRPMITGHKDQAMYNITSLCGHHRS